MHNDESGETDAPDNRANAVAPSRPPRQSPEAEMQLSTTPHEPVSPLPGSCGGIEACMHPREPTVHRNIRSCCATTIESCVRRLPLRSSTHFRVGGSDALCFGGGAEETVTVLEATATLTVGLVRSATATSNPRPRMGAGDTTARLETLS